MVGEVFTGNGIAHCDKGTYPLVCGSDEGSSTRSG